MKPRKPLKRSSPPKRQTPPKRSNAKRRKSEFVRAYGSKERVAWIQAQPSVVSGEGPCINAHVRTGGAGRKADACWIVPMTDQEHQNYHVVGKRFFEKWGGNIDLDALAIQTHARWLASSGERDEIRES